MHMNALQKQRWIAVMLLLGVVYLLAGLIFGRLASSAPSHQLVVASRLAAWVISAVAFAAHIWYEQFHLHDSARVTALHAALAAALGAFALAAAASLHASATHRHFPPTALVIWPLMTLVPAFLVALLVAAGLAHVRRTT
jgi:hypothetical protein